MPCYDYSFQFHEDTGLLTFTFNGDVSNYVFEDKAAALRFVVAHIMRCLR